MLRAMSVVVALPAESFWASARSCAFVGNWGVEADICWDYPSSLEGDAGRLAPAVAGTAEICAPSFKGNGGTDWRSLLH